MPARPFPLSSCLLLSNLSLFTARSTLSRVPALFWGSFSHDFAAATASFPVAFIQLWHGLLVLETSLLPNVPQLQTKIDLSATTKIWPGLWYLKKNGLTWVFNSHLVEMVELAARHIVGFNGESTKSAKCLISGNIWIWLEVSAQRLGKNGQNLYWNTNDSPLREDSGLCMPLLGLVGSVSGVLTRSCQLSTFLASLNSSSGRLVVSFPVNLGN